jgi:hypothetical protein
MNFFHGMIISLLLLLSGQFNIPRRTGATAASGNPCASVPAWTVQYVSSTLTAGTITSWPDSSGNGYTMSISGTAPAVNATDATPNGTQTVKITGAQVGTYSAGIGGNTMSICATYHLLSANLANKMTLTTINGTSGAPAYFLNALGNGPQGLDSSGVVGIGTATAIPDANWTDTCFTYNPSISSVVFYRKGSVDNYGFRWCSQHLLFKSHHKLFYKQWWF